MRLAMGMAERYALGKSTGNSECRIFASAAIFRVFHFGTINSCGGDKQ
jgi:hypothetical protein